MINISEIIDTWEKDGDWRVSPGVDWCEAGNRVICGVDVCIGRRSSIGNWFTAGDRFTAGNWFRAGDGFTAGDSATGVHSIGFADGYWKSLCDVDGVAYIGAGCRWFTLDEAITHWSTHGEDRRATLCLMESARALAKMYGLKTGRK